MPPLSAWTPVQNALFRQGFQAQPQTLPAGFEPVFWGLKPGKVANCFVFVFDLDKWRSFAHQLDQARALANRQYPLPRALRFRHPWVIAIGCTHDTTDEYRHQADAFRPSWLGGEILQAVVIDLTTRKLHAPALLTRVERTRAAMYDNTPVVQAVLEAAPWHCPRCRQEMEPPAQVGDPCPECVR